MMFFKKKPYEVHLRGRSKIYYNEGDHQAIIGVEMLTGDIDFVVYLNELKKWESPYDNEALSDIDKQRMKLNIEKELLKKNIRLEWA